jgi:ring-1,2-phenylacetyl-CoA epoxidase subunit PaaC
VMAATIPNIPQEPRAAWLVRLGDAALVLGHRLSEWSSRAPMLEEDIALSNLALDLIGQARAFYQHGCTLEGIGRDEDQLAYLRPDHAFRNPLLVEQPNGNFADTMARQFLFAAFATPFYEALAASNDPEVAGIAVRSAREMAYHRRHAGGWLIRLGDGTAESHDKAQSALDALWPYVDELFETDALDRTAIASGFGVDPAAARPAFEAALDAILAEATLKRPRAMPPQLSGRSGQHTEHLSRMLAELQCLPRAHPGAIW